MAVLCVRISIAQPKLTINRPGCGSMATHGADQLLIERASVFGLMSFCAGATAARACVGPSRAGTASVGRRVHGGRRTALKVAGIWSWADGLPTARPSIQAILHRT
jgi:hypothetical protein